jgi:hypothetical protein
MFTTTRGSRLLLCAALPLLLAGMAAASVSVKVTNPSTTTATVPLTTTISAQASSGYPITGWYIYVDSKAVWHTGTTSSINATITMTSGTHSVNVRAWDSTGGYGSVVLTLTASGSAGGSTSNIPTAPSYAKVWNHIEDMSGWGSCSKCAANPSNPNPPIASYSVTQHVASPSLDGSGIQFSIWGTDAYADALHWIKFGNQDAYRNFIWDFWVDGNNASLNAQNLEFDFFQVAYARKYMFGTQCNYHNGLWQIWNEVNIAWVNTSVPCHKFQPGVWTHVVWYGQRTSDGRVKYISLTVGGTTYTLNAYEPSKSTSWGDTLGVQYQQDMNSVPTGYTIWVDKIKLSAW